MSARREKRRMARVYHAEVTRVDVGDRTRARFTIHGETPNGRPTVFEVDADFFHWPCLTDRFSKAWKIERDVRTSQIARIDAAVPNPTPGGGG